MVSACLPSDALLQHLPSYLGFSYLARAASLHGCSSKAQLLFLTLDEGYRLTAPVPDLQCGIAPLSPPVPAQPPLLGLLLLGASPRLRHGWLLPAAAPGLGLRVAPQGHRPWPRARGGFSWPPLILDEGCLLPAATGLRRRVSQQKQCKQPVCLLTHGNNHGKDKERKTPCLIQDTIHKRRKAPWSQKSEDQSRP